MSAINCRGCVHYKLSGSQWPCSECTRLENGRIDHYVLPGEKQKPQYRTYNAKLRLVNKDGHYETEEVK
jgi:hypothetical protein